MLSLTNDMQLNIYLVIGSVFLSKSLLTKFLMQESVLEATNQILSKVRQRIYL